MQNPTQPSSGMPRPGQMPTHEQIEQMQRQLAVDAEKNGMTVPQFIQHLKRQQVRMQQQRTRQMQQQQQQMQQQKIQPQQQEAPVVPGSPNPVAIAIATFLRSQELKPRTSILNGERKDIFRVKRALRALQSPAYVAARKKNPALPEITDRASLENAFKLLPMSMLALRVTKIDPQEGHHDHGKKSKRVKGQWTVKIEPQQDAKDDMYYVWMWEGSQFMRKLYAVGALLLIFAVVLYPLWPLFMRQGVYYLSWGFLGLLGVFFLMAIFRVILFAVTYFVLKPGLWLFPNLWEDVSFVDSFKPVWAWHETKKPKKEKKNKAAGSANAGGVFANATGQAPPAAARTTATTTQMDTGADAVQQRSYVAPRVEELAEAE